MMTETDLKDKLDKVEYFLPKNITVDELMSIFEKRLNGRCVSVAFKNENIYFPVVFENIEMVVYENGDVHFCEEEAHYSPIFKSQTIEEIIFDDYSKMPGNTGGQIFIIFQNGDSIDITADF